ncbi:hypothetical protein [Desulfonatronum thiosulfatophilum]|uniref:hypothetical protein n=1 Tax=Desulfonatronum thiosulfatophilum TaxID=617002 RepID=UPI001113D359|nr:hypothetical protein [Desulfonatronum thiosulfatophilum]
MAHKKSLMLSDGPFPSGGRFREGGRVRRSALLQRGFADNFNPLQPRQFARLNTEDGEEKGQQQAHQPTQKLVVAAAMLDEPEYRQQTDKTNGANPFHA